MATPKKRNTPKPTASVSAVLAAAAVDPSEAEYQAAEDAAAAVPAEEGTGESEHVESEAPRAGAWMRTQQPPAAPDPSYRLVSLQKPRRVLATVPAEVVRFVSDDEGRKVLVFDGVRCPRGVVTYHGHKAYLEGGPQQSPHASEIAVIRARLADLEARPVGQFAAAGDAQ